MHNHEYFVFILAAIAQLLGLTVIDHTALMKGPQDSDHTFVITIMH